MLRQGLLVAGLIVGMPALASAQTVRSVLQDYGLVGVWAADCGRAADSGNPHAKYTLSPSGDGLLFSRTGDARSDRIYVIYGAERMRDGRLLLHEQRQEDGAMFDVVLETRQGRLQVWSTQPHEQDIPIRDPVLVSGKLETPMARCDRRSMDPEYGAQPQITPASH
ncbi:MAG TPA: hypothetical protein VMC10_15705 [Stellaceae bacterium]|nr:hypothetical protein [Stellaceae bacterium]